MTVPLKCQHCHQILMRAFLDNGDPCCPQCLEHNWQDEESEAVMLVDCPVEEENVEVLCEGLVVYQQT